MLDQGSLDIVMRLIWQTTLGLVGIGLLLTAGLVLHRLFEERREERHRPAREALRRRLLGDLNAPAGAAPALATPEALASALPVATTARLVDELAQIVRGEARARLAAFAAATGVERHWLARLGSRFLPYRLEAARCLSLLGTDRTRRQLEACLESADGRLRLAAAEALAGQPDLTPGLVARLLRDPAAAGRHAARFWHRVATTAPELLVRQLASPTVEPRHLCRIVEALGEAAHAAAAGPIEALAGQHGPAVDRVALCALERLRHPAMLRLARQLATAAEPDTRRAAMTLLACRAKPADLDLFRRLTLDPEGDIGAAAQAVIDRLTATAAPGAQPA